MKTKDEKGKVEDFLRMNEPHATITQVDDDSLDEQEADSMDDSQPHTQTGILNEKYHVRVKHFAPGTYAIDRTILWCFVS